MLKSICFCLILVVIQGCSSQGGSIVQDPERGTRSLAPVVLMSDFGTFDDGIAICKGVMLKVQPGLSFIDITHQIPAFSVRDAARFLANSTPYFPDGTVFLVLVERHTDKNARPIVAKSKRGQYFVLADNGILSLVAERDGLEKVREIKDPNWLQGKKNPSTFMGRDIYSPVAARLARGEDFSSVGPEVEKVNLIDKKTLQVSDNQIAGEVVALDGPFGNLITDITAPAFLNAGYVLGDKVPVLIGTARHRLPFVKTFDDVPLNEKLLYIDSTDHVAVAINQGNFAERYKIKPSAKFVVITKKEK